MIIYSQYFLTVCEKLPFVNFYGFQTFFGVKNQKLLMKSHFSCPDLFGQSKVIRKRLKYFHFGLQVFWIYRKTSLILWQLFWIFLIKRKIFFFRENSNFYWQLKKLDCMHQFGTVIYGTFLIKDQKYKRLNDWHIPSIFCNYLQ